MGQSELNRDELNMRFFKGPDFDSEANGVPKLPKVLALAQMITDRMGHKVTYKDPDYYGLATYVNEDMAEIGLCMGLRKRRTLEWIVKKSKKPEAFVQEQLDKLSWLGVVEFEWENLHGENPKHEKMYRVVTFVPGSGEQMCERPELYMEMPEGYKFGTPDVKDRSEAVGKVQEYQTGKSDRIAEKLGVGKKLHPEIAEFFNRETQLPFLGEAPNPMDGITQLIPPGGAGTGMHVIPVEKAIESENESVSVEHISHWLNKYEKYSLGVCSCRATTAARGCGCEDDWEWCIGLGDFAQYMIDMGKGRPISYDDVMQIVQNAEKNGFVHQITNIDGEDKIFALCNCDPKICYAIRTSQLFNTPNMSRSAYTAKVDPKNCVACGRCEEVCPAGAVKLGQKLCRADGSRVEYPHHKLPTLNWPKSEWNYNYRDDNRKNTYDSGTAPCKTACPAHIAIQGYIKMAGEGRYKDALRLIKRENPFPAVCGRICNHKCEEACTRGTVDKAVSIEAIKRFVAEQDLHAETRYVPEVVMPSNERRHYDEKIAIVGGGPAGLTCAYYLAVHGYKPTVFEKNAMPGGMMVYGIPGFKLDKKVVNAEIDVLRELGVEFQCGVEVGKDVTIDELKAQGYKAFYIGIGCQGSRKAGVPGEDAEGVMSAVDFLRAAGQKAMDAKSDGDLYAVDGDAVVIGGGNVAVDVARTAARCGADHVSMYCLESRDIMPAADDEVAEAEEDGVCVNCGWGPKEILTDEAGKVTGIVLKKCLSVFDENHRFSPKYDENDTVTVNCSHVYLSIGQSIVWNDLLKGTKAKLGRGNGIVVDGRTYQSDDPCIFAGGDVVTGPKFVIDAIAAGKQAADSIHLFVRPFASSLTIGRDQRFFKELDKKDISINMSTYDKTPRQDSGTDESFDSSITARKTLDVFRDAKLVLTEEQVRKETKRCLSCGASYVDPNKCIGCGLCTTRCEFDAIHLHRTAPECSRMMAAEERITKGVIPYAGKLAAGGAGRTVTRLVLHRKK